MMAPLAARRPPFDVATSPEHTGQRFGAGIALDEATLADLRAACPAVDTSAAALVAAGRDWWPISLHWALAGKVGARPAAVVRPTTLDEVVGVLRICNDRGLPVTPAGGRSGVTGGAVPVYGGVALDLLDLRGVMEVDERSGLVTVLAGTYGPELAGELARTHGLTLGHWPQSIDVSTVGGWVACRSAGQYSTRYGKIEDIVSGLEAVLADGRVLRTGGLAGAGPRSSQGPDLTQLFVGSEGTLGVITAAQLRAWPLPAAERRGAWAFATFGAGLEAARRTLRRGATPAVLRLHDATEASRTWNVGAGHLLLALDEGDPHVVDATMAILEEECAGADRLDDALVDRWLAKRNDVSELAEVTRLGIVADTIEVATRWSQLARLYDEGLGALRRVPGNLYASAHASHSYPDGGCLYFTFAGTGDPTRSQDDSGGDDNDLAGQERFYRRSWRAVMEATLARGGSISHHHGVGLVRGSYLPAALGEGFIVLKSLKNALDPRGVLNPGKLGLPSTFGSSAWSAVSG